MSDDMVGRELFRPGRYADLQRAREAAAKSTGVRDTRTLDRMIETRRPSTIEREVKRERDRQ
jgi:hypothetical protein